MSRTAISVIFPDLVRGMSATCRIRPGTCLRAGAGADLGFDFLAQLIVESKPFGKHHEQHHAHIVVPILADDDGFLDLFELLHLAVYLRRADPHAARIERRIGAALHDDAAMLCPFGEIALMPDARKPLEIGAAVLHPIGVVQEPNRHRGEWLRADKLALAGSHGCPASSNTSTAMPRPGPWISPR